MKKTARRLGLDRRTVKAKVDEGLLERLRRGACERDPLGLTITPGHYNMSLDDLL